MTEKYRECPRCNAMLYMRVPIVIEAPTTVKSITKRNLMNRDITIRFVMWERTVVFCPECHWSSEIETG